ncbi:endochitinase [Arthroderma uncinatum]|uniref:endochitinase n=1 Tax=Arthroderma uncinatum TaxID=74035 RepID=UPI00144A7DE5|nr:endochitinase [Arthroderma uncinatum]KAF3481553.1 endochitinase [Arthroderma uncinatum]
MYSRRGKRGWPRRRTSWANRCAIVALGVIVLTALTLSSLGPKAAPVGPEYRFSPHGRSIPFARRTHGDAAPRKGAEAAGGFRSAVYFVNWAIYARKYSPQDLPVDKLTHVLYAFAGVNPSSGEVSLTDSWSDVEKHFPGDSWDDASSGNNVYGCVKQLFLLKQKNRNLKVLLSVGGWADSRNFVCPASSDAGRARFAKSVAALVLDLGFDGRSPHPPSVICGADSPLQAWTSTGNTRRVGVPTARDLVRLLGAVRKALDGAGSRGRRFLLTAAVPAGPENFKKLLLSEMAPLLDFFNLMAYDYAGNWPGSAVAGHQANLKRSAGRPGSTPFSSSAAVDYYIRQGGVPPSKIVLGMPLYGRAFANTDGPGSRFRGSGDGYSWEKGVWDYKVLPRPGAREYMESASSGGAGASWSYDAGRRLMVSYDTAPMVAEKARYIVDAGLGGAMWWEASGDRGGRNGTAADGSLIATYVEYVLSRQSKGLENVNNVLEFPESRYANLNAGFPNG